MGTTNRGEAHTTGPYTDLVRAPRWLIASLCLTGLLACNQEDCPAFGCEKPGLHVTIAQDDGEPLVHGDYTVLAEAGDLSLRCGPFNVDGPDELTCITVAPGPEQLTMFLDVNDDGELEAYIFEDRGTHTVHAPDIVEMQVRRREELVGSKTFEPNYGRVLSEVTGCGVCETADETLVIAAP